MSSSSKEISFVLDCSVTMAWCFEDEISEYSDKILNIVTESYAVVPALWAIEVSNSLLVAERKKRISHIKSIAFIKYLSALFIKVDNYYLLKKPVEIVLELARETDLSAYDATYLELAHRKNLPIATLDQALKKAAQKISVDVLSL